MTSARFTINGTPSSPGGYDATPSQTLTLQLEQIVPDEVYFVRFSAYDPTDPESPLATMDAPLLALVPTTGVPGTLDGTVTLEMPSEGVHSWILRCTINGGVDRATGAVVPEWTFDRLVALRTNSGTGVSKIVPGEEVLYSPRGWIDRINEWVDQLGGGGGSFSGSATSFRTKILATTVPTTTGQVYVYNSSTNTFDVRVLTAADIAVAWGDVTGKPSTFTPSAHEATHLPGGGDSIPYPTANTAGLLIATGGTANRVLVTTNGTTWSAGLVSHAMTSDLVSHDELAAAIAGAGTGAPASRVLTAGAGLIGGGDLTADRTFNVAATNATIVVDADGIRVGTIADGNISGLAYAKLTGAPTTWAWANITGTPTTWAWTSLTGVPSTFAPSAHEATHLPGGSDTIPYPTGTTAGLLPAAGSTANRVLVTTNGTSWGPGVITDAMTSGMVSDAELAAAIAAISPGGIGGVPTTRQLISGAGLTGGGDLTVDRTINVVAADGTITVNADSIQVGTVGNANISALAYSKLTGAPTTWAWANITGTPTTLTGYGITDAVSSARTITAGAGLTGGGALSADRTINVVAADATITVNADSIQVGTVGDSNISGLAYAKLTGAPTTWAWSAITGKPTTIAGYSITDGVVTTDSRLSDARPPSVPGSVIHRPLVANGSGAVSTTDPYIELEGAGAHGTLTISASGVAAGRNMIIRGGQGLSTPGYVETRAYTTLVTQSRSDAFEVYVPAIFDSTIAASNITATPTASAIVKADGAGKIAFGWLPASATPTANLIPIADSGGKISAGWLSVGTAAGTLAAGDDSRMTDSRQHTQLNTSFTQPAQGNAVGAGVLVGSTSGFIVGMTVILYSSRTTAGALQNAVYGQYAITAVHPSAPSIEMVLMKPGVGCPPGTMIDRVNNIVLVAGCDPPDPLSGGECGDFRSQVVNSNSLVSTPEFVLQLPGLMSPLGNFTMDAVQGVLQNGSNSAYIVNKNNVANWPVASNTSMFFWVFGALKVAGDTANHYSAGVSWVFVVDAIADGTVQQNDQAETVYRIGDGGISLVTFNVEVGVGANQFHLRMAHATGGSTVNFSGAVFSARCSN